MIYYVDATNGNDGNGGMSVISPWKTIGKVNSYSFQPGDSILFKRGEIWRDSLIPSSSGANGKHITFGSYGSGDKPKLIGSISWNDPTGWKNEGNNIWRTFYNATTGPEMLLNASFNMDSNYWNLYLDTGAGASAAMTRTETAGAYYSAPGGIKISSLSDGNLVSGVQFFTSTSNMLSLRAGSYYRLEFKARASRPFTVGGVGLQKNGFPYTPYGSGGAVNISTSWIAYVINFKSLYAVSDARINFYLGTGFPVGTSFYIDDISLKEYTNDTVPPSNVGIMIFNGGTLFGTKKFDISSVKSQGDFYDDSQNGAVILYSIINPAYYYKSIEIGFDQTIVKLHGSSYLRFENLWISQGGHLGFGISNSDHTEIKNCDISYIGGSIQAGTTRWGNGITLWDSTSDIVVENNKLWEIYDTAITTQGTGIAQVRNHTYRNNVVWNSEFGFEFWHRPAETVMDNIIFENNTIVDSGKGWGHNQRPNDKNGRAIIIWHFPASKSQIFLQNNLMVNATESLIRSWIKSDLDNIEIDYNYYSNSLGLLAQIKQGNTSIDYTMSQSSDWITDQNKDANSIFSSESGLQNYYSRDYSLAYNSKAIDSGRMTSRTSDINGNPIYGAPDIGAYEYQPPHKMGIDKIDVTAGARVYGDGKFRDMGMVGGTMADLAIVPESGVFSTYIANEARPHWIDISIIVWNSTKKEWVVKFPAGSTVERMTGLIYTVGDLEVDKSYRISVDNIIGQDITGNNCVSGICNSDSQGKIIFTYNGIGNYDPVFSLENISDTAPGIISDPVPKNVLDTTPPPAPSGLYLRKLQ